MLPKKDLQLYQPLFQKIFSEDSAFCDRIFSHRLDLVFDKREDGKIQSFLFAIPFTARVFQKEHKAVYVYGVATLPEARGKGYMKEVFKKMEDFFEKEIDFYYLVPANETLFSMYEKTGVSDCILSEKGNAVPRKKSLFGIQNQRSS